MYDATFLDQCHSFYCFNFMFSSFKLLDLQVISFFMTQRFMVIRFHSFLYIPLWVCPFHNFLHFYEPFHSRISLLVLCESFRFLIIYLFHVYIFIYLNEKLPSLPFSLSPSFSTLTFHIFPAMKFGKWFKRHSVYLSLKNTKCSLLAPLLLVSYISM